jgi:hypothetical protein
MSLGTCSRKPTAVTLRVCPLMTVTDFTPITDTVSLAVGDMVRPRGGASPPRHRRI